MGAEQAPPSIPAKAFGLAPDLSADIQTIALGHFGMTESEQRNVLTDLDAALQIYRASAGALSAAQVQTQRLLQLLRDQVAEDLRQSAYKEETSGSARPEYPLTP